MKEKFNCKFRLAFLLYFLVVIMVLSGCKSPDKPTSARCIRCGKTASHSITEDVDNQKGETLELNYCDSCYNIYVNGDDNKNFIVNPWK